MMEGSRSYADRVGVKAKVVRLIKKWASRVDKTVPKFITFIFFKKNREATLSLRWKIAAFFTRTIFRKDFSLRIFYDCCR
jgi:hypothetical protein